MSLPASRVRLVVNADGFGSSAERDRAVLASHQRGIVTSTSVLGIVADPAAVKTALAAAPRLGVGILVALSGGAPVAPARSVPSLLGPDERLPGSRHDVILNWAKAALVPGEVEREIDAQVGRLRDAGLVIDHLAVQDDLGFLPMIAEQSARVARRHGIAGLRVTVERPTLAWVSDPRRGLGTAALGALAWVGRRQLGTHRHGPQSWGCFEQGRLDEVRILEILGRLGPGCHELICHPELEGDLAQAPRHGEAFALTSTRVYEVVKHRQIELCRWTDLF